MLTFILDVYVIPTEWILGFISLFVPAWDFLRNELLPKFGIFALDLWRVDFDLAELIRGLNVVEDIFDLEVLERSNIRET